MHQTISHGATLARPMTASEIATRLSRFDARRAKALIHVAVVPGPTPGNVNVEAWPVEGTDPLVAFYALGVARDRLRIIHGLDPDDLSAPTVRRRAEQLVDMIRASIIPCPGARFDHSREACVRAVAEAIRHG